MKRILLISLCVFIFITGFAPPIFTPGSPEQALNIINSAMRSDFGSQIFTKGDDLYLFCKSLGDGTYGVVPVNLSIRHMLQSLTDFTIPSRIYNAKNWGQFGDIMMKGGWTQVGASSLPKWFRYMIGGGNALSAMKGLTIVVFPVKLLQYYPYNTGKN